MSAFATVEEVIQLSGMTYTAEEQERIDALLPMVSDALRFEAQKVSKDLDAMITDSAVYANVVKLVTVDIVIRVGSTPESMASRMSLAVVPLQEKPAV